MPERRLGSHVPKGGRDFLKKKKKEKKGRKLRKIGGEKEELTLLQHYKNAK